MLARARQIYEIYEIPKLDLSRSTKPFGSSHTVVTYPPLKTLGVIRPQDIPPALHSRSAINLYVHIPFCRSRCGYCSYVSEPGTNEERRSFYLSTLARELEMYSKLTLQRPVGTAYIGGGTPTILHFRQLASLMSNLTTAFDLREADLCVEANPVTLTGHEGDEKLELLIDRGVRRISIGVQSFSDNLTKRIGRGYYTSNDARDTVQKSQRAGARVNVDLMQDLPGQTFEDLIADLAVIAELQPDSVTWYTMRVDHNCWLARQSRPSQKDSLVARILITEELKDLGYRQTSGDRFCLADARDHFKEARSSTVDLLGMGVSAYSHLFSQPFHSWMFQNETDVSGYIQRVGENKLPVKSGSLYWGMEREIVNFVMGLRNGIHLTVPTKEALFENRWTFQDDRLFNFFNQSGYRKKIPALCQQGLLELSGDRLQFTAKGRLFENEVCRTLYSPIVDAKMQGKHLLAAMHGFFLDLASPRMVKA